MRAESPGQREPVGREVAVQGRLFLLTPGIDLIQCPFQAHGFQGGECGKRRGWGGGIGSLAYGVGRGSSGVHRMTLRPHLPDPA